jgi:hypothetical protein
VHTKGVAVSDPADVSTSAASLTFVRVSQIAGDVDSPSMNPLARHPGSIAIVLAALAVVAAVFTLARPQFQGKYEGKTINLAEQDTISPAAVRAAFAAEGVQLRYSYDWEGGVMLSNLPPDEQGGREAVQVTVGGRTGMVDYGPQVTPYDERFENVLVTYDGTDRAILDRVEAAVDTLKSKRQPAAALLTES